MKIKKICRKENLEGLREGGFGWSKSREDLEGLKVRGFRQSKGRRI